MKNRETAILVAIVSALSGSAALAQGWNPGGGEPGGFFGRGGGGGEGFRRGGRMGGGGWHEMKGVHELKSLTPEQKQKIKAIMQDMRSQSQALMQKSAAGAGPDAVKGKDPSAKNPSEGISITNAKGETQDFGGKFDAPDKGRGFGGRGGWRNMDPETRQKMKQIRADSMTKIKAILSPEQLSELRAMRQGQFMPRGGGGDLMPTEKPAQPSPQATTPEKSTSKESSKSAKKAQAK